jgi:hypothetical protein
MQTEENYRPKVIEFNVAEDDSLMPGTFGEFETAEEANKFIGGNFVSTSQSMTVARHMDNVEKKLLREKYENVLENVLPINESKHTDLANELSELKRKEKDAAELVSATMTEVKGLSQEVKRGLREMNLDENYTSRIAYKNRFYFYTYIDKALTLCKIKDIPEHEKSEIFNDSAANEEFIEKLANEAPAKK